VDAVQQQEDLAPVVQELWPGTSAKQGGEEGGKEVENNQRDVWGKPAAVEESKND
jgi:hypothetical protein